MSAARPLNKRDSIAKTILPSAVMKRKAAQTVIASNSKRTAPRTPQTARRSTLAAGAGREEHSVHTAKRLHACSVFVITSPLHVLKGACRGKNRYTRPAGTKRVCYTS